MSLPANNQVKENGNQENNKGRFRLLDVVNDRHRVPASDILPCDIDPHQP
jgi:hypothetical protein